MLPVSTGLQASKRPFPGVPDTVSHRATLVVSRQRASILLHVFAFLLLTALFAVSFLAIYRHGMIGDEIFHADQIRHFAHGDFGMNPSLTTLPGYHALLTIPAMLLGRSDTPVLRLLSLCLGLLTIPVFFLTARKIDRSSALVRTLQFTFIPILFPFFFLVYTDITGLLFLLVGLLALHYKRYWLSALFCIASILVRQNVIVWLGFALYLAALTCIPPDVLRRKAKTARGFTLQLRDAVTHVRWLTLLRRTFPYLIGIALFTAFVLWNHGIAIGDEQAHPFPAVHTGNIFFALLLWLILFLPLQIAAFPRVMQLIRRHWLWLVPLIAAVFFLYWFTFHNTHAYNQAAYSWWLRNRLLVFWNSSDWYHALFFIPVCYSILALMTSGMLSRRYLLIYPLTIVYLVPSWLVEQRYYLVPFALFLLYRKQYGTKVELIQLLYAVLLSGFLFIGIVNGLFFL